MFSRCICVRMPKYHHNFTFWNSENRHCESIWMTRSKYIDGDDLGLSNNIIYIEKIYFLIFSWNFEKWYIYKETQYDLWGKKLHLRTIFVAKMTKIRYSDYNKQFQCPISFPRGNLMFLNTFLTLFWYFIHFFDPKSHFEARRSPKKGLILAPKKGLK